MNRERYKDPTAEFAIAKADKWEKRQQELEEKHGIKRGEHLQIITTSYSSGNGKVITKKVNATVKALYPHVVELKLSNGLTRSPTYWELKRIRAGGDTNGKERTGAISGTEGRDKRFT